MTQPDPHIADIVRRALDEDIGPGDVTTRAVISSDQTARGELIAREHGVLAGMPAVRECFRQAAPACQLRAFAEDADVFDEGDVLADMEGPAAQILTVERVALNFLQQMCGTATLTRKLVDAIAGYDVRIIDTRKTLPGLRQLQKMAVRAGGGYNHRFALYDGVILKDNHITAAGGIEQAVARARANVPHTMSIEVEAEELEQVEHALSAGADIIMLDNMTCEQMKQAVDLIDGRALIEASGGITAETVEDVARTGVDLISVGSITHSAPAIDISLELTLGE